jgi:hypothetical protein
MLTSAQVQIPAIETELVDIPAPSCKSLAAGDMRRGLSYACISSLSPHQKEAANGSKPLQRL